MHFLFRCSPNPNAKQRFLWAQCKAMTRQFAHDMLLAEGNSEEIAELYPQALA
ncbi:hypothetical protein [Pseudomonas juntendi]|uniref:hypothetical protein n=1 Tax=Pseudomonas juntendi TaxID=2666183 RepID=UPI0034670272